MLINISAFSQFQEVSIRFGVSESSPGQASIYLPGISAGLEAVYAVSNSFSVRSGLGYDYKYTKSVYQNMENKTGFNILSLPVYMNYNASRFNFYAGPSLRYLSRQVIYSKGDYYYDHIDPVSGSISTEHVFIDDEKVVKNLEKRFNIGIGVGMNVNFSLNENFGLLLDLRGDLDLLKERYRFISGVISGGVVYKIR